MVYSNKLANPAPDTHNLSVRTAYSYQRLSTTEQLKGSGLTRQADSALAYCRENNLRLDDTLKLSEEVSAFKGDNVLRGKLGKFLELVDKGKVKKGALLLVENLDRLSRQNVLDAQELFLSIINRGITIVTLMDKQVYSRDEIKKNPTMLLVSLLYMFRANEESETKSKRIRVAKLKRRTLGKNGKSFKVFCPPWCDWIDEKFKIDLHKASIVGKVFRMYLDGMGMAAIATTLNQQGEQFIGRGTAHKYKRQSSRWYKRYVRRLLSDERLIGRANWCDNDDYFPPAIDKEVFNQVQFRLSKNERKGGQTGRGIVNIFAGMMRCGNCGSSVCKARNKNGEGYEYNYLICENARTGGSCKFRTILLDSVEISFLYLMRFRPWFQEAMQDDGTGNETENRIEILKGEQFEAERQLAKIRSMILTEENPPKTFVSMVRDLETKTENIKARLQNEEGKRADKTATEIDEGFFYKLPEKMKDPAYRLKVREVIRNMVKTISLNIHSEHPHYIIERTNGNFWSVVFLNRTKRKLAFQIFKGRASKPYEGDLHFDSSALRAGEILS